eukprot:TRINITY_DN2784_c0_g1_i1.p1 TRINITY_DN2784_c0_g1~~TRINITY_DN2784_c0_g1_i1.p1  ORF type:complete len:120 (-),score=15.51 TRINITY_DN2784_c0_g1_i1:218-556(-)
MGEMFNGNLVPPERNTFQKNPGLSSKLLERRDIDEPDELDISWEDHFRSLQLITSTTSEKETMSILQNKVSESMDKHADVTTGLLYGILTDVTYSHSRWTSLLCITTQKDNP